MNESYLPDNNCCIEYRKLWALKKKIFSVKMLAMNDDYISSVKSHNQITQCE